MYNQYQQNIPVMPPITNGQPPAYPRFNYSPILQQCIGFIGSTIAQMTQEDIHKNQARTGLYQVVSNNNYNNDEFQHFYQLAAKAVEVNALANRVDPMSIIRTVCDDVFQGFLAYIWTKYFNQPLPPDQASYLSQRLQTYNKYLKMVQDGQAQYNGANYQQSNMAYVGQGNMGYVNNNIPTNPMAMYNNQVSANMPSIMAQPQMYNQGRVQSRFATAENKPNYGNVQPMGAVPTNPMGDYQNQANRQNHIPMSSHDTQPRFAYKEENQWQNGQYDNMAFGANRVDPRQNQANVHNAQLARLDQSFASNAENYSIRKAEPMELSDIVGSSTRGMAEMADRIEEEIMNETVQDTLPMHTVNTRAMVPMPGNPVTDENVILRTDDPTIVRKLLESEGIHIPIVKIFTPIRKYITVYYGHDGKIRQKIKDKEWKDMNERDHDYNVFIERHYKGANKPTAEELIELQRQDERLVDQLKLSDEELKKQEEQAEKEKKTRESIPNTVSGKVNVSIENIGLDTDLKAAVEGRDCATMLSYKACPILSKTDYTEDLKRLSETTDLKIVINKLQSWRNKEHAGIFGILNDIYTPMVKEIINVRLNDSMVFDDLCEDYADILEYLDGKDLLPDFEKALGTILPNLIKVDNIITDGLKLEVPKGYFANIVYIPITMTSVRRSSENIGLPTDNQYVEVDTLEQPLLNELGNYLFKNKVAYHYIKTLDNRYYVLLQGIYNKEKYYIKRINI